MEGYKFIIHETSRRERSFLLQRYISINLQNGLKMRQKKFLKY